MRYYLLKKTDFFTGEMEIIDFHQQLDYRLFSADRMYQMPTRLTFRIKHREYAEYPQILLDPLPLFNKTVWRTMQSFIKKPLHTHFIFLDEKTRDTYHYYCPLLHRVRGKQEFYGEQGEVSKVRIYPKDTFPDGLPVLYLDDGSCIQVLMGLDILESLMRKDLCDIRLVPVQIMEE